MVLADYPMPRIVEAITQYIRKRPDMPRPADIEAIINPPLPKPDWAVYVALQKKVAQGGWLFSDERAYLATCERYAIDHAREQQAEYADAQRQIALFRHLAIGHDD